MLLAGGTDWIVERGLAPPENPDDLPLVLDVSRLPELRGIQLVKERAAIGAAVTFLEIRSHPGLLRRAPVLTAMAREVGAVQTQARGTLGGNLGDRVSRGRRGGGAHGPRRRRRPRERSRRAAGAADPVLHGLSRDAAGRGRGDRPGGVRPPPDRRTPDVAEGGHARGAGDLEGRSGRGRGGRPGPRHPRRVRHGVGRARDGFPPDGARARPRAQPRFGLRRRAGCRDAARHRPDRRHPLDRGLPRARRVRAREGLFSRAPGGAGP